MALCWEGFLVGNPASAIIPRFPYAAPNICVAAIQALVTVGVIISLNETLEVQRVEIHHNIGSTTDTNINSTDVRLAPDASEASPLLQRSNRSGSNLPHPASPLSFPQIWTSNVLSTMFAQFIISGHLGTFASLWAIFLSTPVNPIEKQHLPVHFSGGLGLQPRSIGIAMSVIGFAGIALQVILYPTLRDRFGTIRLWRAALFVFPILYILAPFCSPLASYVSKENLKKQAGSSSSVAVWLVVLGILVLYVGGRTCIVPATSLLINDCTPHPSVRGTIHTAGVISSNLSRSIFPPIALAAFGLGTSLGVVGLGFWFVAALAMLGCAASLWVTEGANGQVVT